MSQEKDSAFRNQLQCEALSLGFNDVRVTHPDVLGAAGAHLSDFVRKSYHGDMAWFESSLERRQDPHLLMADVQTVIMLGMNYGPSCDPLAALNNSSNGVISVYAKGKDYHDVIKAKLKHLARWIASEKNADVKVFVDTAALMEKPFAQAAGLGWQGKHTNLVSRSHGSWLFLAAILTSLKIEPDANEIDHCGNCRACLDVCPTRAFPEPYKIDARRCISYLTIEHKGHIPLEFRRPMGNRIFGCDDCLAVCPWNKFARVSEELKFAARSETDNPPLGQLLDLDDAGFRARFAGTSLKRTGRDRFVRNVLIAVGNSDDRSLVPQVLQLLSDGSLLVRAMAVWASSQLLTLQEFRQERDNFMPIETEQDVVAEWLRENAK